jgi:hypothetical protein
MGEKLLLWIFHATNEERQGVFHHCYARTANEARLQEMAWMAQRVNEGYGNIEVKHYSGGFRPGTSTYWPGSIDASEVSNASQQ